MPEITVKLSEFAAFDLDVFVKHWGRFNTPEEAAAWLIETALYRGKEAALLQELKPGWLKCLHGTCPSAIPD